MSRETVRLSVGKSEALSDFGIHSSSGLSWEKKIKTKKLT